MCGILGFVRSSSTAATVDTDLANVMSDGMLVGALRGMDSFGYFHSNKNNKVAVEKHAVPATIMYGTAAWVDLRSAARDSRIFVGHHRAKTTGVVSKEAAHPYTVTSDKTGRTVTGVHNGSLVTWSTYSNGISYLTDSQYLFAQIAEHGPEALRTINGAYAVAFTMSDAPGKLFIARNKERPLAFGYSKDGKIMVFGSEHLMLEWLVSRPIYAIPMNEKFTTGGGCWADIEPFHLYEFNVENPSEFAKTKSLVPPAPVVKPPAPPAPYIKGVDYESFGANDWQLETYKKRFPTCTDNEIHNAVDFQIVGNSVQGVVKKIKRNKHSGRIAVVIGEIISDDSEVEGCKFYIRQPPEAFDSVLEGKPGEVGVSFIIGGCADMSPGKELCIIAGELKFVYNLGKPTTQPLLSLKAKGNA